MPSKVLAALVALAMPLAFAPVADAHRVSLKRAQAIVDAYAEQVVQQLADEGYRDYGASTDRCKRRSAHRVTCGFAYRYREENSTDNYVCSAKVIVRLRSPRSKRLRASVTDPKCEVV